MIRLPRWLISVVTILLLLNPVLTAVLGFYRYNNPGYVIFALAAYLAGGLLSVLYYKQLRMPLPIALLNLGLAVIVPLFVNLSLDETARGTQATWYVTGIATLLAINAIRQHKIIAWIGFGVLTIQIISWGGFEVFFNAGLAGALGLVVAAHAISVGLENSSREASGYLELAKSTAATSAVETAIRAERSTRLNNTLQGAMPILKKIANGEIGEREREEARLLEADLRDEIRGRMLLNPRLKLAVRSARSRGVEVVLLDEGGLEGVSEENAEAYRDRLSDELEKIREGRVTIRAPHQDRHKVTFVASRSGTAKPDVWLQL
ncbi:MAG: hypothetical protein ACKOXT_04425 [Actinomycetota bacterium]